MSKVTLSPWFVREALQESGALVTASKVVFTDTEQGGSFGGFVGNESFGRAPKWRLVVGTLIVIPLQSWEGNGVHGWHLDQIIQTDGLDVRDPALWTPSARKGKR